MKEVINALHHLQQKLLSKKMKFMSGLNGLQACHVAAIETHLRLIVKNGQKSQYASECAAESRGFAPKWRPSGPCADEGLDQEKNISSVDARAAHQSVFSTLGSRHCSRASCVCLFKQVGSGSSKIGQVLT